MAELSRGFVLQIIFNLQGQDTVQEGILGQLGTTRDGNTMPFPGLEWADEGSAESGCPQKWVVGIRRLSFSFFVGPPTQLNQERSITKFCYHHSATRKGVQRGKTFFENRTLACGHGTDRRAIPCLPAYLTNV